MLPARFIGGPGKEVPPERARTTGEKMNGPLCGMPEKTRRPASRKWTGSAYLVKTVALPAMHSGD
jgi:hypothetical protein